MKKELAVVSRNVSIEAVIQNAIDKGVPVETMERLLAMRRELKAEASKEAYDRAMSLFQEECPVIQKTKQVKNKDGKLLYAYAPIESIVTQVKSLVKKHGFSYTIDTKTEESQLTAICKVTHEQGHSDTSRFTVPADSGSSIMSAPQKAAAALTFAKRYAFCNAFGILTGDEDTDATPVVEERTPMKPYSVAKTAYPKMDKTNDAAPVSSSAQKMEIAKLLQRNHKFTMLGKSAKEVGDKVFDITGLNLEESNYSAIAERLASVE